MTLTEFLLARIAEDEAAALEVQSYLRDNEILSVRLTRTEGNESHSKTLEMFPPTRVLAECEAKRRIVEEHAENYDGGRCRTCNDHEDSMVNQAYPCLTIRTLEQPYADHPDFREEWKT